MICCIENRIHPSPSAPPPTEKKRSWTEQMAKKFDKTMNAVDILQVHLREWERKEEELQYFGKRLVPSIFESNIAISKAIFSMFRYDMCDHYIVTIACIYIKNLMVSYEILKKNINTLIFTAIMVGAKFARDIPYDNCAFSRISDIDIKILNEMESLFLQMTEYKLLITEKEMKEFLSIVKNDENDVLDLEKDVF